MKIDGDARLPALLLLHGFLSSNLQWEPNWTVLREHFRLVAVELWGHGKSPVPNDPGRYEVSSYIDEFERIRMDLGIDAWTVCGQSFGAGIMLRYAHAKPDRVNATVITNSRSALSEALANGPGGRTQDEWEATDLRSLPFHPRHAKRFPPELKEAMEHTTDAMSKTGVWLSTEITGKELSCREVVTDLCQPLLLVNGKWEKAFQPDRDFAAANVEGIQIADLEGGHSVNIEAPEAFNQAVIEFGASVRTTN